MGAIGAFFTGLRRVVTHWPVLLALYAASLLAVLPLAILPAVGLAGLARRPVIADLAGGVRAAHLLDLSVLINNLRPGLEVQSLASYLTGVLVMPLALPLLGALVSAFAWGGALLVLSEAPAPFNLRRFLWGGWHWFGSFLALALIQDVLFVIILLPLIVLGLGLALRLGTPAARAASAPWAGWPVAALIAGLSVLWLALFELARIQAVITATRSPFRAIGRAAKLIARRPLALLLFYALALLLLVAVHALYRGFLLPDLPLDSVLIALVVQQSFIIARLLARTARAAGLVEMARPGDAEESPVRRDDTVVVI